MSKQPSFATRHYPTTTPFVALCGVDVRASEGGGLTSQRARLTCEECRQRASGLTWAETVGNSFRAQRYGHCGGHCRVR